MTKKKTPKKVKSEIVKIEKAPAVIDPKKIKTKLEDEENLFKLEMMGGNSNKAYKFVDEYGKEIRLKQKKQEDSVEERLEKAKRGPKFHYYVRIAEISIYLIARYSDLPKFFTWGVYPTEQGVVYWLKNMKGEVFKKAIKPIGDAHIDMVGGVYTCIRQLENTAIRERNKLKVTAVVDDSGTKKSPGGIILPG